MRKALVASAIACMASGLVGQSTQFGAPQIIPTGAPQSCEGVYTADLDGDGDMDVLSAFSSGNTIGWNENTDGLGTFGPLRTITTAVNFAVDVYAADVDADGDMDVFSASVFDNKVAWYENLDGLGNFGPQQVVPTNGVLFFNSPEAVIAADLDGDGDLDVVSGYAGSSEIIWNENTDGQGTFGAPQLISGSAFGVISLDQSDFDGDGDIDLISIGTASQIAWHENADGLGNFGPPHIISNNAINCWGVDAADIDGDGDVDAVCATGWYENTDGLGAFGSQIAFSSSSSQATVNTADLDNDGDADVISASLASSTVAWHENLDGLGAFGPLQAISSIPGEYAWSISAADIDGDGDVDIVSTSSQVSPSPGKVLWHANQQISAVSSIATSYGAGCGSPPMAMSPTANAIIGQLATGEVTNTPTPFCVVAFGTSNSTTASGAPLPFSLSVIGMPGCSLYHSAEVPGLPTTPSAVASQVSLAILIPSIPTLVGQHFYLQAFSIDPNAAPRKVISSNGIDFLIGNQ